MRFPAIANQDTKAGIIFKYWELVPYLGFGLGAHGFYNGKRYGNVNNLTDYCELD